MPRRPRPLHRTAPGKVATAEKQAKLSSSTVPKAASKIQFAEQDSGSEEGVVSSLDEDGSLSEEFEEGSSQDPGLYNESLRRAEDDEADADAPRIAQWEDDEVDFSQQEFEDEKAEADLSEKTLKNNLQDLPLGALRQAQRVLSQAEPESDSGSEGESGTDSNSEPEVRNTKGKGKEKIEKVEWSAKPRKDISKRSSKHAPTEVTSKRPVTRRRTVVEVPKIVPRDPRFLPTAGEFSAEKFHTQYSFLADNHRKELSTLRETLKQARKLLASSPRDLRSEREHEVYRLEQAIKRAESMVNKDRLDRVQRETLSKAKKEEQQKRTQGKGEWYLKKGEKQKLIMEARYEALAKEGGQRAVKKVIEKRQKKQSQKEKRSRPYAKGEESGSRKRGLEADAGWPNAKRRRV
ncbi:hypothetical protein GALMADRAFT_131709 [Galerina marginata CBS 339.88]|uniref:rRNA biogenesis protein RRP36 n=1 Tax=Galerina marginata (strain CBS 339.88) TaxID=685588 RepID=A0A067TP39_GALM3|nr:hypothetical protein GALMADRAFT_131709 [Galerina marginata CBS 339.88]